MSQVDMLDVLDRVPPNPLPGIPIHKRGGSLFDAAESEKRKREGMAKAADASWRMYNLRLARIVAADLCRENGSTDADQVGRVLKARYGIDSLGPAAGSLFKTDYFEWTGEFVKSERKTNHSRLLRVWRLKK